MEAFDSFYLELLEHLHDYKEIASISFISLFFDPFKDSVIGIFAFAYYVEIKKFFFRHKLTSL